MGVSCILVALAALAAIAVVASFFRKKSRAMEQMAHDLNLIQKLSTEISSVLEQDRLLPLIMDAFARAVQVNKGSLMLLDEATGELVIKAAIGLSERAWKLVRPKIGEGIAGKVAATGQPVLINDTTKNTEYKDYVRDDAKGRPRETMLCLPLTFNGRVLGTVTLDSKITGEQFMRNDEILLSILAGQAAVAIYNAQLYEMAITDGLTKLFIVRYFQLRMQQEVDRARRYNTPLSLMMLDLDHFKGFNDANGHQAGDMALVHLAKIMKASTRTVDICARYGGEEFAVILPETDNERAFLVAERFRKNLADSKFNYMDKTHKITASVGVATFPFKGKEMGRVELIKHADIALYHAKENGRNQVAAYEKIGQEKR